jgi:hypothetical protein
MFLYSSEPGFGGPNAMLQGSIRVHAAPSKGATLLGQPEPKMQTG